MDTIARNPTLTDVARAAGVSRSTAARALSGTGYVDSAKRRHIEETAARLGYRGSAIARALRTNRSKTVGILIADITNPIFPRIVRGADEALTAEGITLLLCNTDGAADRQAAFVREMLERKADGLILVSQSVELDIVEVLRTGPPAVFVNRTPDPHSFDYVGPNNKAGIDALLDHLTSLGHRRLGFVHGPQNSSTARERFDRFQSRMAELGLPVSPSQIYMGDYTVETGRAAADALLKTPPDQRPSAILAANDFVALGLIDRARAMGLSVPEDLSVTGFDDAFGDADWHRVFPNAPRIVTVDQPRKKLGRLAAELLLERIADPSRTPITRIVDVGLVPGSTTAPPRAAF
ncbi:LacI family DNA-binding transcriptional regulator [Chelativorans sp. AA-79]|uniref:LacI family DNA-binding transcriptional regulator n=1 Tax=Chelativorans sp. AA-79 TaxID=3028735 RepID=UPI0023F9AA38|nr:LacI family DNA-binding transcriptional regulator [Chelativorans sp. AA-79]WEX07271.1 LacI family DNA-binding transcriptional regulator [Chelativorans sp. AA-79]